MSNRHIPETVIAAVLADYRHGIPPLVIAERHGVSETTVYRRALSAGLRELRPSQDHSQQPARRCEHCGINCRRDETMCHNCQNDDSSSIELDGGQWVQRGLVRVWVPKAPVTTIHEWRALKADDARVAEIRSKRADVSGDRVLTIIDLAADHFGVTVTEILGRNRVAVVVDARHVAAWALREEGMLLTQIGEVLGRDHSTISYGVDRVARTPELLAAGVAVRALVEWDDEVSA